MQPHADVDAPLDTDRSSRADAEATHRSYARHRKGNANPQRPAAGRRYEPTDTINHRVGPIRPTAARDPSLSLAP
eukprot:921295-Prymnesium_polylepis.3